jgi:alkanesulfonate monooxygenase SsuD/methylene tetrahydromethanopterin reductase-like flavin-dependent oxidoreductase (luciferase family)
MTKFAGEYGAQFTIQLANQYTVPELVDLARLAHDQGLQRVWVADFLRYRSPFTVMAAIAAQVPIKVGTAVMVPYFRNPIDVARTVASISELADGREVSLGIARGGIFIDHHVQVVKPITMVRETAQMVSRLLAGDIVQFGDYPLLASYYRLPEQAQLQLDFRSPSPVRFYCGGNGPKIMEVGGRTMDGVLISGHFIAFVRTGKMRGLLARAEEGARQADPNKQLRKIAELNLSISRDRRRAREFPKQYVAHNVTNMTRMDFLGPEDFRKLGLSDSDLAVMARLREQFDAGPTASGATFEAMAELVPDSLIDATFLAGTPEEIVDRAGELLDAAAELGFDEISFAKLGPDYDEALHLLGTEVLPML